MSTVTVPSRETIEAAIDAAGARIRKLTFVESFTIEDYPIGSRNRGLCKLEVEYRKGNGWRTVRTTTNKHGQWCKPKKSTYDQTPIAVVTGDVDRDAAWLRCSDWGDKAIYLQAANGDCEAVVLRKPDGVPMSKPNREDRHYTVTVGDIYGNVKREEKNVLAADPPEVCDAWDVWEPGLLHLFRLITQLAKGE